LAQRPNSFITLLWWVSKTTGVSVGKES